MKLGLEALLDDPLFLLNQLFSYGHLLFDVVIDLGGDPGLLNLALYHHVVVSLSQPVDLITCVLHTIRLPREVVFDFSVAERRCVLELS